jgi:hypothetical protein
LPQALASRLPLWIAANNGARFGEPTEEAMAADEPAQVPTCRVRATARRHVGGR